jgi:hypothetical protein
MASTASTGVPGGPSPAAAGRPPLVSTCGAPKRLVECREVLLPVNQEGAQREVDVRSPADVDVRQRAGHVEHAAGMDIDAKGAQEPAEMNQVWQDSAHRPALARFRSSETR